MIQFAHESRRTISISPFHRVTSLSQAPAAAVDKSLERASRAKLAHYLDMGNTAHAWYGFSMSRRPVALAAFAALALSLWLARPACGAVVEPGDEIEVHPVDDAAIEPRRAAPEQPATTEDWKGIRRDTWYFLGYQALVVSVLYALPEETTQFNRGSAGYGKWRENVTNPVWDNDDLYINYVLHPYWGAAYYIRARERGLGRWQSLGYSALLSTLYEFGAEALFEPVSYQDLVITPLIGSLIGEYVFSPVRNSIRSKPGGPDGLDKLVLILTDPLGALNDLTNRVFGAETQLSLAPMAATRPSGPTSGLLAAAAPAGSRVGWLRPDSARLRGVTWGLRLEVRW